MHIFTEIVLILSVATVVSCFMRLLKQPLVVGYIISGIIVGPYFLNIVTNIEYMELFSKLGIAILLFIVGLSLKPDIIREVGKVSLVTGLGQVFFTSILGFLIMRLLGFDNVASMYSAIALTFSSTIIILKLLSDKGDLDKLYGKISIGFLLVQDIVATIILLVVSIWGSSKSNDEADFGLMALNGLAFFCALYLLSKYVIPKLSIFLAKSQESLFLFSITWGLGMAGLFYHLGFSFEIGALVAGVALSVSSFSQEISSRMKPLRDFFILLFFVVLGSQMVISSISSILIPAIILSLFILIGNPVIVIVLMNLIGHKSKTAFMAGLTVAQISEFSLILMSLGFSFGHLTQDVVSLVTLVGIITISGSTYLILYSDKIYAVVKPILGILELRNVDPGSEKSDNVQSYEMIIFGYDRTGYDFVKTAQNLNRKYLVVDFNPSSIQNLEKAGIPNNFGDAEDVSFLEEIKAAEAKIIISTIPDFKTNLGLVSYYHNHNPLGVIIVMSHDIKDAQKLYASGASFVVMPHYLGASFASQMLETHGTEISSFEKEKEQHLKYINEREKFTR